LPAGHRCATEGAQGVTVMYTQPSPMLLPCASLALTSIRNDRLALTLGAVSRFVLKLLPERPAVNSWD
jgi:hypothetical protein